MTDIIRPVITQIYYANQPNDIHHNSRGGSDALLMRRRR